MDFNFFDCYQKLIFCYQEFVRTRYFIFIAYKGTSYHGWQLQPNAVTVQKVLEETLSTVLCEQISTIGAGRTDTGVHASYFCAHFDTSYSDLSVIKNLIFRLNCVLPRDISVSSIQKVISDANARFSAVSRTYNYYIIKRKDPFKEDYSWYLHGNTDVKTMNEACEILMKYNDFTSFSKLHSGSKTNICQIYSAFWKENEHGLVFTIKADRFLRNMVRAIVGTIIETGIGKMNLTQFERVILDKNRCSAGKSVPAKGLFLTDIEYPPEIFIESAIVEKM
jgi:tRNA pseudouridine38-40 synthase